MRRLGLFVILLIVACAPSKEDLKKNKEQALKRYEISHGSLYDIDGGEFNVPDSVKIIPPGVLISRPLNLRYW